MSSKLEEGTSKLSIEDRSSPAEGEAAGSSPPADPSSASKPKRVRTGCLTCRERHLKCDEGMPICQNCKKSNRQCKRGVRLNFIDTKVEETQMVPQSSDWNVSFQDESRDIASEYRGGSERYAVLAEDAMDVAEPQPANAAPVPLHPHHSPPAPRPAHQPLPPIQSPPMDNGVYGSSNSMDSRRHSTGSGSVSSYTSYQSYHPYGPEPAQPAHPAKPATPPPNEVRDCLTDPEEVLFMQVFVEEVGLWMDSMDPYKHFSRILPFYALAEPMLLNSFLACGARHLNLINPAFSEDRAIHYYDTATRALLRSLQNPSRDTIICATAAVILNVYEVMTERALQRMNHIAGARALIKECGWNARSVGIGSACFWLNVGMEVWSCLHFNWQVAWNPDDWGVDMTMEKDTRAGNEEAWTHKILYVSAKVANFRATVPRFQESNPTAQAMRQQDRTKQWENLKWLCDTWNEKIPRTMHPAAFLLPHQKQAKSLFPEVWLIKRASIMGRLFYHSSMCLLGQMHPGRQEGDREMTEMTQHHSRMICGIVAHNKDRGVASAGIRCISVGAECLTDFKEQEEILTILRKIKKETGWRIDFLEPELRKKWGWTDEYVRHQQHIHSVMHGGPIEPPNYAPQSHRLPPNPSPPPPSVASGATTNTSPSAIPAMPQIPRGIVNPTMRMADFNAPNHAYQNYWVAPNPGHSDAHYLYRLTDNHYHG